MTLACSPRLHHTLAGLALAGVLGLSAACSSGGGGDAGGSSAADDSSAALTEQDAPAPRRAATDDLSGTLTSTASATSAETPATPADRRALIKQGAVALRADDVDAAKADVLEVMDRVGGEVASDDTAGDDDGAAERVRLTLRVPVDDFADTLAALGGVADLVSTSTTSEDVTTRVIDTDVRVRLQRRSIERISVLLDRARSIRDVVAIERQLASRQAALDSLEKRQAFLADQTALGTIAVSIQRTPEKAGPPPKDDDEDTAGFVSGLHGGWDAFTGVTVALLTALGAVLPFGVVLLLLGVPAWVLLRRRRVTTEVVDAAAGG